MSKRIAMVLTDRANWGRLEPLAAALRDDPSFDLHLICGGTTVLNRFKAPADDIEKAGYRVSRVFHELEGSTHATMAQSIGLGVLQYVPVIELANPEYVIIIGDRYEALAAAIAASALNRNIIHLQGGEISGSLDEKWRHAITKLADWHVPATELAKQHIITMGERHNTILAVGCPSSDIAAGITINPSDMILVMYHPNTADDSGSLEMAEILAAIEEFGHGSVKIFWPNVDAGSDAIAKLIRVWRTRYKTDRIEYITNVPPREYQQMLADAALCVGNSSSFVRDASYYGTAVVLVGSRQDGREHDSNVTRCEPIASDIVRTMRSQFAMRYPRSTLYGDGKVVRRIVWAIKNIEPYFQKRLSYEFVGTGCGCRPRRVQGNSTQEPCGSVR